MIHYHSPLHSLQYQTRRHSFRNTTQMQLRPSTASLNAGRDSKTSPHEVIKLFANYGKDFCLRA